MIRLAAVLIVLPTLAQADVLICNFTPQTCPEGDSCETFGITINTHHGADTPHFDYWGTRTSILVVPEEGIQSPTYVTLSQEDREIVTLFNGFDAIHTRHFTLDGHPQAQTSTGDCYSFW